MLRCAGVEEEEEEEEGERGEKKKRDGLEVESHHRELLAFEKIELRDLEISDCFLLGTALRCPFSLPFLAGVCN